MIHLHAHSVDGWAVGIVVVLTVSIVAALTWGRA